MNRLSRLTTVVGLLLPMAGAPLAAQSWRADLGVNGGASWYSPMLGGEQINNANGNVRFQAGWLAGAQATLWVTPRIGIRANGTYTDRPLKQGNGFMAADNQLYKDINLWSGSGDLMLRLRRPGETFTRMEALPYIALGLGAKWHNPAGDQWTVYDPAASKSWNGLPFACGANGVCGGPGTAFSTLGLTAGAPGFSNTVGVNAGTNAPVAGVNNFFLSEERVLMGLAGLGTDLRLSPHMGLRLEVGDRMYKPALIAIAPGTGTAGANVEATNSDTKVSKTVHEVYAQLGLHMLFGLAAPPVVAVAPAPAPPPPPPAPAPTTQDVSVCVVDPTAATGLNTVTATFNPATNDTTVMINGTATPLAQAYTSVPVASGSTWYVQGQPLMIGSGNGALAYVSFGSARNIEANDLTYIGTVNGLPVYANRTDVTNLTIPSPPGDITTNTTLLTGLRNVQVVYVPLTATGCNFQPLQIQEQVRKVRK